MRAQYLRNKQPPMFGLLRDCSPPGKAPPGRTTSWGPVTGSYRQRFTMILLNNPVLRRSAGAPHGRTRPALRRGWSSSPRMDGRTDIAADLLHVPQHRQPVPGLSPVGERGSFTLRRPRRLMIGSGRRPRRFAAQQPAQRDRWWCGNSTSLPEYLWRCCEQALAGPPEGRCTR